MNFGEALEKLKAGKQVAREAWSEHRVCLMQSVRLAPEDVNGRTKQFAGDGPLYVAPYFVIHSSGGHWTCGWQPSADEMLAGDWEVCS